jgi:hypothetical protein
MINIIDNIADYLRLQSNLSEFDIADTIVDSSVNRNVIILNIPTSSHENKPLRMTQEQVQFRFRSEDYETAQKAGADVWDLLSTKENEFTFPASGSGQGPLRIQRQAVQSKPVPAGLTESGQHEFLMNVVYEYSEFG